MLCQQQSTLELQSHGDINDKTEAAKAILLYAGNYMREPAKAVNRLGVMKLTYGRIEELTEVLLPQEKDAASIQGKNVKRMWDDVKKWIF